MKTSFFPRFLAFSGAFWSGTLASIFLLTAINAICFFPQHFWPWFLDGIHYDLLPVAGAEMFRSPIMGLLFAWLGNPRFSLRTLMRFGAVCGASSYAVADACNLAGFASWSLAPYFRQPGAEHIILGLPVVLIILSRFSSCSQTLFGREENPSS
jgi:hypothetical protein